LDYASLLALSKCAGFIPQEGRPGKVALNIPKPFLHATLLRTEVRAPSERRAGFIPQEDSLAKSR